MLLTRGCKFEVIFYYYNLSEVEDKEAISVNELSVNDQCQCRG